MSRRQVLEEALAYAVFAAFVWFLLLGFVEVFKAASACSG